MAAGDEIVLTLPRSAFSNLFGASFRYVPLPELPRDSFVMIARLLRNCVPKLRTPELESDPLFKQVVVYTVLRHRGRRQTRFWLYRRANGSGEGRLLGKYSLGVGGHVNEADWLAHDPPFRAATLVNAAARELREEVGLSPVLELYGFVNDESNPVGRVHLGCVFVADLNDIEVDALSASTPEGIDPVGWRTAQELYRIHDAGADFEPWSESVLAVFQTWNVDSADGVHAVAL